MSKTLPEFAYDLDERDLLPPRGEGDPHQFHMSAQAVTEPYPVIIPSWRKLAAD